MTSTSNLQIVQRHLPEQCYSYSSAGNKPKSLTEILGIVQHYFSGRFAFPDDKYDADKCWQLMHDLNFEPGDRRYDVYAGPKISASAHFINPRTGPVIECVPLRYRAHHAGTSWWDGRKGCNRFMIGIENIGSYGDPYTDSQYENLANLVAQLMLEHPSIRRDYHVGHSDVSPGRKKDPGPSFDWNRLNEMIDSVI